MNTIRIKKRIVLCLIAQCFVSNIGLCFISSSAKWFLISGNAIVFIALFLFFILTKKSSPRQSATAPVSIPSPPPVPTKTIEHKVPPTPQPDWERKIEQLEKDLQKLQQQKQLLFNFENNHINVFESQLENIESEPSEEEMDDLFEEFVDIALLSMGLVNAQTRDPYPYSNFIKDLVDKKLDKKTCFALIDSTARLPKKYKYLSKMLKRKLPERSFFYSGNKL